MTAQGGPTGPTERALAPDLARGFMLLFITLANSHHFVHGTTVFGGFPMDGSVVDRVVGFLISTLVDGRAFPMFGLLFGYGVAQIVRRQRESGQEWRPSAGCCGDGVWSWSSSASCTRCCCTSATSSRRWRAPLPRRLGVALEGPPAAPRGRGRAGDLVVAE
ncbi:DUF418 domain-containing protein [Kribbella turkmenica]|uniref:hypothetical protein n=1 Tax=Kribbella turkmenica TaxID=2530375 RepID=UPI001F36EF5D|nr:hypothetical protein [Kribbella turkmenica]